jgi:hypothetical protein
VERVELHTSAVKLNCTSRRGVSRTSYLCGETLRHEGDVEWVELRTCVVKLYGMRETWSGSKFVLLW